MEAKEVGKRVKELMKKRDMTIEELADKMKISKTTLSNKLNGNQEFYVSEIINITKTFNLSIIECTEIFFDSEIKK